MQVQAYMQGSAVSGVVEGALESVGTPNRLLQTELSSVPSVIVSPAVLQPVVLFESSFAISNSQSILLNNTGNTTVDFEVGFPAAPPSLAPAATQAQSRSGPLPPAAPEAHPHGTDATPAGCTRDRAARPGQVMELAVARKVQACP